MLKWLLPVIILALTIAFLVHFSWIIVYGGYHIQEPSPPVLFSEVALLSGILVFALIVWIKELRRIRNDKRR